MARKYSMAAFAVDIKLDFIMREGVAPDMIQMTKNVADEITNEIFHHLEIPLDEIRLQNITGTPVEIVEGKTMLRAI